MTFWSAGDHIADYCPTAMKPSMVCFCPNSFQLYGALAVLGEGLVVGVGPMTAECESRLVVKIDTKSMVLQSGTQYLILCFARMSILVERGINF